MLFASGVLAMLLGSCATGGYPGAYGSPNMGGPLPEVRAADIASEPSGNFYYGRRYFVKKTRFWGYLRKPRQSANTARLVVFNESKKRNPDRLPEEGPPSKRYGFDQNYEYKIYGYYTGDKVYTKSTPTKSFPSSCSLVMNWSTAIPAGCLARAITITLGRSPSDQLSNHGYLKR